MVVPADSGNSVPITPAPEKERRAFYESLVGGAIRGTWQIGELLDFGSMGAVYHVRHKTDRSNDYAVKILDPDLSRQDRRYVRRFVREARILREIDHPNVVKVYEHGRYAPVGVEQQLYYYVMDLIHGPDGPPLTLHRYAQSRSLRMDEVIFIITQILAGLHCVHKKGVVHRDLKPWNVLVDRDRRCRIVDFGLAKIPDSDLTMVDELFGSRDYIAPELFYRGAREATPAADIFAVGRIFAELVDRVDFRGQEAGVFASKSSALKYLDQLLARLAEDDPSLRYGSAEEVMNVLKDFVESTRIRTKVHSSTRLKKAARIESEGRRNVILTIARWLFDYGFFFLGLVLLPTAIARSPVVGAVLIGSLVASKLHSALTYPPDRHPVTIVLRALTARLARLLEDGDCRVQYFTPFFNSPLEPLTHRTPRFRARHVADGNRQYRALVFDEGQGIVGLAAAARCAVLTHTMPRWGTPAYRAVMEDKLKVSRPMWSLFDPSRRCSFCVPIFRIIRKKGREDLKVIGVLAVDSRLPDAFMRSEAQRAVKEYAAVIQDVMEPGHAAQLRRVAAGGAAPLETLLINGQDPVIPPVGPRGSYAVEPDPG